MALHAALGLLRDELPGLMDKANWDALPASFREAAKRLGPSNDLKDQERAAGEVWQGLAAYPAARDVVDACSAALSALRQRILPDLRQALGDEKLADAYATSILHGVVGQAPDEGPVRTRGIKMGSHGLGGAKTVKLRNVLVHPGRMVEFAAHSAMFPGHTEPVLIGLGIILLANCVREAITIHIPEHDATVLWGLIQAQKQPGNAASASEADVVTVTNSERMQANLGALPPQAVTSALQYLAGIKCIEQVPGNPPRWRIVESYKVK
jgi:hypothetical protein